MSRGELADVLAARLGARVRELRIARKLTISELAERMVLPRPVVGRIERGVHVPTYATLCDAAHALGVPLFVLLAIDWSDIDAAARRAVQTERVRHADNAKAAV